MSVALKAAEQAGPGSSDVRNDVAVFVDPPTHHLESDRLFDVRTSRVAGGIDAHRPYVYLRDWFRQRGLRVHTADLLGSLSGPRPETNVYISLGILDRYKGLARRGDVILSGFFALECPVVEPALYAQLHNAARAFKRVYSYSTEEALAPFLQGAVRLDRFLIPQSYDGVFGEDWERRDRSPLVIINANKLPRVYVNELYTERLRAVEFFNRHGEIDLYGIGWDVPPHRMGRTRVPARLRRFGRKFTERRERLRPSTDPLQVAARQAFRGRAESKSDVLSRYTFAICFENSVLEGWITEKIFDCFYAGTVPVYWGAPDIERWIPPDCYVDMRRFAGYEDLRRFLFSLSPQEIDEYRVAARDFLGSDRYRPFSKEAFAELVGRIVAEDTGVPL